MLGPGPDHSNDFRISLESPWTTPAQDDRLRVTLELSSEGYRGPGEYACGLNVLESGQQVGVLCSVVLLHFLDAGTLPAAWHTGPQWGPHPNCFLSVLNDDDSAFNGTIRCEHLDFWDDLPAEEYNLLHPDRDAVVDVASGSWGFPYRVILSTGESTTTVVVP